MLKYCGYRMFRGRNNQWIVAPETSIGNMQLEDLAAFATYDEAAADAKAQMELQVQTPA